MATIDEMTTTMNRLIDSEGSVSIPGLDFSSVVDNLVEKKYADSLSACETSTERMEMKDRLSKYYTEGEGKLVVQTEIASIKSNFSAAKDQLSFVSEAVVANTASNLLPPMIGTASPNPAYIFAENKVKLNQMKAMLKNISACIVNLLKSAINLMFQLPSSVMAVIDTFATVKSAVESIPVA